MKQFTNSTIIFGWKVNKNEYTISIVEEEVLGSVSNQKSLHSIIKSVFIQIKIDNFEELTLIIVSYIKNLT